MRTAARARSGRANDTDGLREQSGVYTTYRKHPMLALRGKWRRFGCKVSFVDSFVPTGQTRVTPAHGGQRWWDPPDSSVYLSGYTGVPDPPCNSHEHPCPELVAGVGVLAVR
eukprot:gene11364-biopygen10904